MDPPGFDYTPRKNSFEQFISNIANEQLLYHYNQTVFAWEMVHIYIYTCDFQPLAAQ